MASSDFDLTTSFLAHVANLYEDPFAAMAAGRKLAEYRDRAKPDPVIEALRAGTPIIFRACGSPDEGLLVRCAQSPGRVFVGGRVRYTIPILGRRPILVEPRRKTQGWHTCTATWVREGVLRVAL